MDNFCTLFDSNYLDKGIALYDSLKRNSTSFFLYVYAFDQKAYDILKSMNFENMELILIDDILTEEYNNVRQERSRAEFCWTCTSFILDYTFTKYHVNQCTYIDADLYFYDDPRVLIAEMEQQNASVQIVEHRFPNFAVYRRIARMSGKYCVQFNTFKNDENGRKVLTWWKKQCLDCCTSDWKTGNFGDQKYLDSFQTLFKGVQVLKNEGGGVAPWNICKYKFNKQINHKIFLFNRDHKEFELVFYHFHDMQFCDDNKMNIRLHIRKGKLDESLVKVVYQEYGDKLKKIRGELKECYNCELPKVTENNFYIWKKDKKLFDNLIGLLYLPQEIWNKCYVEKKDIFCL